MSEQQLSREECNRLRDERKKAMDELRQRVKQRKIRYAEIALRSGNSSSWVGVVLRGGYPYYGAYYLPKNIRVTLQEYSLNVPNILWTF